MLIMRGSLALSHFRLERLRAKINHIAPQVDSVTAEFIHFIDIERPLTKPENDRLSNLLSYSTFEPMGPTASTPTINATLDPVSISMMREQQIEQSLIFVVPKPGIISFWSQKATEIAHYCDLKKIRRIERGIVYSIAASERLTWGDEQAIANLLYNVQTETILYRLEDTEFLFKKCEQKPIQAVNFLQDKKPIATFVGFNVAHLRIPGFEQSWENTYVKTKEFPSSLETMLKEPVWQRKFNHAFECPQVGGYFRTYEPLIASKNGQCMALGYHPPFIKAGALFGTQPSGSDSNFALKIEWENKLFQNKVIEPASEKRGEIFHEPLMLLPIDLSNIYLEEAIFRLLKFPCIADKSFLITIQDRTVTGHVVRDQMVGPWQVPVADCAVLVDGFDTYQGSAIAIGERTPLAALNPAASARMAVGEAMTNIVSTPINASSKIQLSVNCEEKLENTIAAICTALSPALDIDFSVNPKETNVIVSAYAPVIDVRTVLTPLLVVNNTETLLIFVDVSGGAQRLGGSALAQVFNQIGDKAPDIDNPALLNSFFKTMQQLQLEGKILAYHDRSDGGLFITLCEMAFASHKGLQIDVSELGSDPFPILFNEELGAVIQIRAEDIESVLAALNNEGINGYVIGTLDEADQISIVFNEEVIFSAARIILQKTWSENSFHLQALRDNPRCAKKQFEELSNNRNPGLNVDLTFDLNENIVSHFINVGARPRIAILHEEGTQGHMEMATAFERAHFECIDVHMRDLASNARSLTEFKGLAVSGGFSFGDILGAGLGWAKRILFNTLLSDQFEAFFNRTDTFTLGLSNGCQMLVGLKTLIPGAELMPQFRQNYSEQFESRLCLVEVQASPSVLLQGMEGSRLLVPVAHKEGRVVFKNEASEEEIIQQRLVSLRYVDNWGRKTKTYPANPSGSALGISGLTTTDGRVLCMMPHPDRAFRTIQHSWHPGVWGEDGPWLRMFQNARKWIG